MLDCSLWKKLALWHHPATCRAHTGIEEKKTKRTTSLMIDFHHKHAILYVSSFFLAFSEPNLYCMNYNTLKVIQTNSFDLQLKESSIFQPSLVLAWTIFNSLSMHYLRLIRYCWFSCEVAIFQNLKLPFLLRF